MLYSFFIDLEDSGLDNEKFNTDTQPEMDKSENLPRPLHLTKAVYIRHILPSVAPSDILEVSIYIFIIIIAFAF